MQRSLMPIVSRLLPEISDQDLLGRYVQHHDHDAFAQLVTRYNRLVWGQCRNLLANDADADDAFQATFLTLARSAKTLRAGTPLGPWLHGVAFRTCLNARRARGRRAKREKAASTRLDAEQPVADSSWEKAFAVVAEEVQMLPEAQRVAFVLCYIEGRCVADAAASLGLTLGTFTARLSRAKQALLDRVARRGLGAGILTLGGIITSTAVAPAALVERTIALLLSGASVPGSVQTLTSGVTGMTMTPIKLLAAAVAAVAVATFAGTGGGWTGSAAARPSNERSKLAAPIPAVKEPEWVRNFGAAYQLKEGEYLKRVAVPFVPERRDFVRTRFPGANDESLAGLLTMGVLFVEADGKTVSYRAMVSTDAIDFDRPTVQVRKKRLSLPSMVAYCTGRLVPEVVFDDRAKSQDVVLECDVVIRKGSPLDKLLPDLQKTIRQCGVVAPDSPPIFSLKEEVQEVYVVTGKFTITQRKWRNRGEVDVYADEAVLNKGFTEANPEHTADVGTSMNTDPPHQFVRELGAFVNRRMVWEADAPSAAPFRAYTHSRWEDKATADERAADRDPEKVLKNVSEQTGLTFKKERRKVQVVYVAVPEQKP